jgi:UDP-N-acetylmuramoyl-L-alanyl-D-glutamate--2,6-diaminopimelate ligase
MEFLPSQLPAPTVVVDYAHTPDSLIQSLKAARLHCHGVLWCVFGCGGNRDRGKRSEMARAAETYADRVVVTDDNPRFEDPKAIAQDIALGFSGKTHVQTILDRAQAIDFAVSSAGKNDLVLIAGKGHETYQLVGDQTLPFSDALVGREALTRWEQTHA